MIDSHCHLDDPQFDEDRAQVLERAQAAGVRLALCIGGIALADSVPWLYATAGIHPHEARTADAAALGEVERLTAHAKVLAVGEIGLDFHYDNSPRDQQREAFLAQLAIARRAAKPIVIHTRDAWQETLDTLRLHWSGAGIMHCFTGDYQQGVEALDLGMMISFAGVLTFPKAATLRDAAARLPLDRILIETDCPYLAPVPHRGKRNEPAFVAETARVLAQARGLSLEAVMEATTANFLRLFPGPWGTL